ncbi:hypothetical protein [Mesorhizobium sp. L-8-3]|uniref:hypothetical protein n=1 Tax=Mesorhizobium sp. L-8-3 TaxID=2744522 RepID=UPI0019295E38|nr:hypothetical protein [Mesorhizobium sp. L-8-3]
MRLNTSAIKSGGRGTAWAIFALEAPLPLEIGVAARCAAIATESGLQFRIDIALACRLTTGNNDNNYRQKRNFPHYFISGMTPACTTCIWITVCICFRFVDQLSMNNRPRLKDGPVRFRSPKPKKHIDWRARREAARQWKAQPYCCANRSASPSVFPACASSP